MPTFYEGCPGLQVGPNWVPGGLPLLVDGWHRSIGWSLGGLFSHQRPDDNDASAKIVHLWILRLSICFHEFDSFADAPRWWSCHNLHIIIFGLRRFRLGGIFSKPPRCCTTICSIAYGNFQHFGHCSWHHSSRSYGLLDRRQV